jgi:predicted solute-binding protein
MKKQILSEELKRMQKLAGIIIEIINESNQITPEFDELKKQQTAIKKQQEYLIKISDDLKIDKKLINEYNWALYFLLDAISKAYYDK